MVISASYTDKGGNNIKALTGSNAVSLRSNTLTFNGTETNKGFGTYKLNNTTIMILPAAGGWLATDNIDLTGVHSINIICGWQDPPKKGLGFEVRLDSPEGTLLGSGAMGAGKKGQQFGPIHVPFKTAGDGKLHHVYIIYKPQETILGGITSVQFNP